MTVFVSYARQDQALAKAFIAHLANAGETVWWDGRLREGEPYDLTIAEKVREASCVIVLWSKTSVKSEWVRGEATIAYERRTLFPILVDRISLPPPFNLLQGATLKGGGLSETGEGMDPLTIGPVLAALRGFRPPLKVRLERVLHHRLTLAGIGTCVAAGAVFFSLTANDAAKAAERARKVDEISQALTAFQTRRTTLPSEERAKLAQIKTAVEALVREAPSDSSVRLLEVRRLRLVEGCAEALAYCQTADAATPGDSLLLTELGYLNHRLGRHADAVALWRRSIAANTDKSAVAMANHNLAVVLADRGSVVDAKAAFRTAFASRLNRPWMCTEIQARVANDDRYSDLQDLVYACRTEPQVNVQDLADTCSEITP